MIIVEKNIKSWEKTARILVDGRHHEDYVALTSISADSPQYFLLMNVFQRKKICLQVLVEKNYFRFIGWNISIWLVCSIEFMGEKD